MPAAEFFLPERTQAPHAVTSADPEALTEVLCPGTALAISMREAPNWTSLRPLLAAAPFSCVAENLLGRAAAEVLSKLPATVPPAMADDLLRLAATFGMLAKTASIRIRLEGIIDDGC